MSKGLPCALANGQGEQVVILNQAEQSVSFSVPEGVTPSLLRGFSAPVVLDYDYTPEQLARLLAYDSDGYCRWNAAQRLYFAALDRLVAEPRNADAEAAALVPVLEQVITRSDEDPRRRRHCYSPCPVRWRWVIGTPL